MGQLERYFTGKCARLVEGKRDAVIVICGSEGAGKSSAGLYCARLANPKFGIEDICFSAEQFMDRIDNASQGTCLLLDEGGDIWYGRSESMSRERTALNQTMMKVRERNLLVLVIISDIRLLESYIRGHRASCLCHVTNKYNPKTRKAIRGIIAIYKKSQLLKLPRDKSGSVNWRKMRPTIYERFPKVVGPLWDSYIQSKREYLGMIRKKQKSKKQDFADIFEDRGFMPKDMFLNKMQKKFAVKDRRAYQLYNRAISEQRIAEVLRRGVQCVQPLQQ